MRLLWPETSDYILNGELDKAAHPIVKKAGLDGPKPDLPVHSPGDMDKDNTIKESKTRLDKPLAIAKDLETLHRFRTEERYRRAIYLVFGSSKNSVL